MSKGLTRTHSLRKHIRPLIDINEEDDEQRRDSSGRKRVDVVQCLLDSSSDEMEDENFSNEKTTHILWLTFAEICHIRCVLTQTTLSLDKQYLQIRQGHFCFRCRKKTTEFFFLPSFLRFTHHEICFICQQNICKRCSYSNFLPPSSKLSVPIRIQTLIKPPSIVIENKKEKTKKPNTQTKTICYDCLQIFNEHIATSQESVTTLQVPVSPFRRTFSLPPMSSINLYEIRSTYHRHRRRPLQVTNYKIEKTTITATSLVTKF